jgi:hypothetical protein
MMLAEDALTAGALLAVSEGQTGGTSVETIVVGEIEAKDDVSRSGVRYLRRRL